MRKLWIILMRTIFTAGNANDKSCPGGFNRLDKLFFQKPLDIPANRCYNKYVIKSKERHHHEERNTYPLVSSNELF